MSKPSPQLVPYFSIGNLNRVARAHHQKRGGRGNSGLEQERGKRCRCWDQRRQGIRRLRGFSFVLLGWAPPDEIPDVSLPSLLALPSLPVSVPPGREPAVNEEQSNVGEGSPEISQCAIDCARGSCPSVADQVDP